MFGPHASGYHCSASHNIHPCTNVRPTWHPPCSPTGTSVRSTYQPPCPSAGTCVLTTCQPLHPTAGLQSSNYSPICVSIVKMHYSYLYNAPSNPKPNRLSLACLNPMLTHTGSCKPELSR